MLFNSGNFIIFFPIVVILYYCIPARVKHIWLLLASYFFYMCWNAKYSLILLSSTLITYIGALILEKHRKKSVFAIVIILNLGILFYFKYLNFAVAALSRFAAVFKINLQIPVFDIVLPVGISFYILQALGYLIDVYRGDIYAEHDLFRYALFVSFFPQLVAGPIERSRNLLKQLATPQKPDLANIQSGILTMIWGYFLKLVIADRCAILVNNVYQSYSEYSGIQLILATMLFSLQIYCDFMGYSIIAKGGARVLGIDLIDNFRQPFFATSIKDFWRRWHISLSTWFRDYLYIPLGGSRCSRIRKYTNLMITFIASGLWHGANFTYIVWGATHGLYQMIEDLLAPHINRLIIRFKIKTDVFSWRFICIVRTYICFILALVFFRAESLTSAFQIIRLSFDLGNIGLLLNDGIYQLGLDTQNMNLLFIAIIPLFLSSCFKEKGVNVKQWILNQNIVFRYALYWSAMILIILSLDITGREFIYFQF